MLSVIYDKCQFECRKQAYYAECRYAVCHYAECRYAECRGAVQVYTSAKHANLIISFSLLLSC
jgi:hypothetical protein